MKYEGEKGAFSFRVLSLRRDSAEFIRAPHFSGSIENSFLFNRFADRQRTLIAWRFRQLETSFQRVFDRAPIAK